MLPITLRCIHKASNGQGALLRLGFGRGQGVINVPVSLEQARLLLADTHGIEGEHQAQQRLTVAIARVLGAEITRVVLIGVPDNAAESASSEAAVGYLTARVCLQIGVSVMELEADLVAAVSLATHLDLPVFFDTPERPWSAEGREGVREATQAEAADAIPPAFLKALEDLGPI